MVLDLFRFNVNGARFGLSGKGVDQKRPECPNVYLLLIRKMRLSYPVGPVPGGGGGASDRGRGLFHITNRDAHVGVAREGVLRLNRPAHNGHAEVPTFNDAGGDRQ